MHKKCEHLNVSSSLNEQLSEWVSFCLSFFQIFEWWYFRKYGTSFIEQVSVSHLRPLLGGVDSSSPSNSNASNGEADSSRQSVSGKSYICDLLIEKDCKKVTGSPTERAGWRRGMPGCICLDCCSTNLEKQQKMDLFVDALRSGKIQFFK